MKEILERLKMLIIFGSRQVDGYNRDGKIEKFYKAKNDEYHYFYMVEYLREHLKNEIELQNAISKMDINSLAFEMQKLGHIMFLEKTSHRNDKIGILYRPKEESIKQRESLLKLAEQLRIEDYNIIELSGLHRDNGIITGRQRIGKADMIVDNIKEKTQNNEAEEISDR